MSKVIFKLSFKHPNFSDSKSKNIGHVNYIATRSGVDKTLTEADLARELEKGIEKLADDLASDDQIYLKYIDERPRSHGLFDADGIADPKQIQQEIGEVDGCVWRGIISLKEVDAKDLGYLEKEKWQTMLRKTMPDMASQMGIRFTNLRWVGAIHMEKGHPHAHVMVWEKEPERLVGIINTKTVNGIRKLFTDEIFEEQRFQILNEKNIMRELIRDLAKNDVSAASKLIKEVRDSGQEIAQFIDRGSDQVGIAPKLFNDEEKELAEKLKNLADIMPGKGRAVLKFMPENVKLEVMAIADYLLIKPEFATSLERNLKATEELTKLYTGKEDDIKKARDKAYKDIRDRLCQVILKGAVESQKDNLFYVDQELSQKAINFIRNLNSQINLIPEQTSVVNQISLVLAKAGQNEEQIYKTLKDFLELNNINYPEYSIKNMIKQIRESGSHGQEINSLSSSKNVDSYLSALKLAGATEQEAFFHLKRIIKIDSQELNKRLEDLREKGILKKDDGHYKLTNKGIEEILRIKDLDKAEKEILKMLETNGDNILKANFRELLDNKNVFGNLQDKDPEEIKIGKFDTRVREVFGQENRITFSELEAMIFEKYTDNELNTNVEKAERELEILQKRIEKLTLNGYVEFDKETGSYSFTPETDRFFEYDQEKEVYFITEEAAEILGISKEMEFTRYDANVTLSYIDQAEKGILRADQLRETLHREIANKTAEAFYTKFIALLDTDMDRKIKRYVSVDAQGNLSSTEEGKSLGINLNKLNKYFKEAKGSLTDEKLKEICSTEQEYQSITKQLGSQIEKGHIIKDQDTGIYKINPVINDIKNLLYQIYKEGGSFNKVDLKEILERNIPNRDAENQFKYLTWRLENLKTQGYLYGHENEYRLNDAGIEKRADILIPERDLLRGKLIYLERLGLITQSEEGYQATDRYYKYMKDIAVAKEQKLDRSSNFISSDVCELIDRTQDKVNVGKIERTNERIATGKYINDEYKSIETDYESIRAASDIPDTIKKTISNLSTTLMVSGMGLEETKEFIQEWNIKSNSHIPTDKLNEIISDAHSAIEENNLWGKTTLISTKDWKSMFESFGVDEREIPKWIYRGENWQSLNRNGVGMASLVNDIWKSAWRVMEQQRLQTQAQAEMMKKQMAKQVGMNSKEARLEQAKKQQARSLYKEEELEN